MIQRPYASSLISDAKAPISHIFGGCSADWEYFLFSMFIFEHTYILMYPSFILVKTGEEEEEEIEMGRKHNYPLEINFKGLSPELNRSRRVMNTR